MAYRDAPGSNIRLPREVYYRCVWTVRDMERLKKMASVLAYDGGNSTDLSCTVESECAGELVSEAAAKRAEYELRCIEKARASIPEVYREGLLDNIINKEPFSDFAHPNTWKRWKLVFLYELAKELCLI